MNFYNVTPIKSCRKPKRCYWCGQMIEIGQPKTVVSCTWDGDFHTANFHTECESALVRYQDKYGKNNGYEWPEECAMVRGGIENRFEAEQIKEEAK